MIYESELGKILASTYLTNESVLQEAGVFVLPFNIGDLYLQRLLQHKNIAIG